LDKAPDAFRTISEVADDLKVPQHVLRFWESRFAQIKPMKRAGGRRYYRPDDVDLLRGIHHLLYGEGYTIRGVQRILKEQGIKFVETVWQEGAEQPRHGPRDHDEVDAEDGAELPEEDDSTILLGRVPVAASRQDSSSHASGGDLSRDDLRKLQATLFELNECKRLLEGAGDKTS
jgi:DNA-binding transcriptional MerR regulator